MITKILDPTTKTVTFVYPAYTNKKPLKVSITSSYHASILHNIFTLKFVVQQLQEFTNQRSQAYSSRQKFTPSRIQAISAIRKVIADHQEGKLLSLYIAILRAKKHIDAIAPSYSSPLRHYYDKSISKIVAAAKDEVSIKAPYVTI